jgi:hypothetical protein
MDVTLWEVFIKQFVILVIGLVTAFFAYRAASNAKQANNAVNHKGEGEKTLRENVLDIRESVLGLHDQVQAIRGTQLDLGAKLEEHVRKHP